MFTSTRVTRLGVTNSLTELRLHVRHDLQTCIFESSQAIGVENQVLLKLWHQRFQASQLDLVVHLALQLLLVARNIGLPASNSRLEFQKRATSRRKDRAKKVPPVVGLYRVCSLRQGVLPRVGNNVIRLGTRESHRAGCICCTAHSRFCTPRSWFVAVGRN